MMRSAGGRYSSAKICRTVPTDRRPQHRCSSRIQVLRSVNHVHERSRSLVREGLLRSRDPRHARARHTRAAAASRVGARVLALHHRCALRRARRGMVVRMSRYVALVLQTLVAVALAPALTGFIRWLKSRLQGRRGAPPWQPYFEIRKLFGKEAVVSHTASWIFTATPFVVFSTAVVVASLVPLVVVPSGPFVAGDLFAAVYLLLLGTFFLALAGLDTGSPFGGMGASREMTVVALTEPTVALSIVALALNAGSTSFSQIVAHTLAEPSAALGSEHLLAFAALFIVTLAETGRLPLDNPLTDL